jgi:glyoxylase-like metal-dependent hydrolase (beta-lactamase superfamily II)
MTHPQRIEIGNSSVIVLHDLTDEFPKTNDLFPNLESALLEPFETRYPGHFGSDSVMRSPQNAFLVLDGDQIVLIDAGLGPKSPFSGRAGRLLEALLEVGVSPQSVTSVLLTHPHPDHLGWLINARGEPNFSSATHYLNRLDRHIGPLPALQILQRLEANHALELFDGEPVLGAIQALATPGHTPGHTAYLISGDRDGVLIAGDALVHPLNLEHPNWGTALDRDAEQAVQTRIALIGRLEAQNLWLGATHFASEFRHVAREGNTRIWA